MSKAIVCHGSTQVSNSNVLIDYNVSIIGPPNFSYGSTYQVDTGISVSANLTAWKNKIIAEVVTRGITITGTDIIVFGAPS
jgi:hypothetical protein